MSLEYRVVVALVLAGLGSSCTFYTCPSTHCGETNNPGTAGAGSNANGGSGAGGGAGTPITGSPTGDWTNVTSNLAGLDTMCGNTGLIIAKPDEDRLIVAVALHGLWSSVDGGQSWKSIKPSSALTNSVAALVFDPDDSGHYWVVGNHASPYLLTTANDGKSFTTPGDGSFGGLDYLSVDFSDPKRKTLVVGEHESPRAISLSTDSGATWKAIGKKLPANDFCTVPLLVDAKTFIVGCADGQLQRTTNTGATWSQVTDVVGSNRAPLVASDASVYWAGTDGSLVRTTDGGETWTEVLSKGTLADPIPPIELPDGRIAAYSATGIIVGTSDGPWSRVTPPLPGSPWTMTYSQQQSAFFYAHGDCNTVVPDDAIMSYPFDDTKN